MVDKTTSTPDIPEYKFTDSEVANEPVAGQQPEATTSSPTEETSETTTFSIKNIVNTLSAIDKRKFMVPGAIILAILLIYGISSFYGAKKSRLAEQKKLQAQEMATMQRPMIPIAAPIVTQPSPGLSNEQMEKQSISMQQKLSEAIQEASKSNLDKITDLTNTVSKTQQDVSDINQTVNQLTVAMQQVLAEIESLKVKPVKKKPSEPLPVYHIRAIVPGRVWLESSTGKSITLKVGDNLKGYGTVEVISPQKGLVVMSNGAYIQYGVNDF